MIPIASTLNVGYLNWRPIPNKIIHQWFKVEPSVNHPPMLDHSVQSQRCKVLFQSIRSLS
ncbi:hypothetical protein CRENPOLYSF1_850045 [Crenothrix polyspora]|uniref:Uncharacterized protein n=1 Tax=Crenothrix polyspora TaxID=360316 RepID=A0A1R4HIS5_9GAMM|nr:hypothetical protein CRENPOLYSF1_850045 [Crenothrix polyspora]